MESDEKHIADNQQDPYDRAYEDTDVERAFAAEENPAHGVCVTPKMPPTFDGSSSFFEFEDLMDDRRGITTLAAQRLGPSLKNALVGPAAF